MESCRILLLDTSRPEECHPRPLGGRDLGTVAVGGRSFRFQVSLGYFLSENRDDLYLGMYSSKSSYFVAASSQAHVCFEVLSRLWTDTSGRTVSHILRTYRHDNSAVWSEILMALVIAFLF